MHVIPNYISGSNLDPAGKYRCPICGVQKSSDEADTGWVYCPMISGGAICLGCCIDHQKVARSLSFEDHYGLFRDLSKVRSVSIEHLRRQCLEHQLEVIDAQLTECDVDSPQLEHLKAQIIDVKNEAI